MHQTARDVGYRNENTEHTLAMMTKLKNQEVKHLRALKRDQDLHRLSQAYIDGTEEAIMQDKALTRKIMPVQDTVSQARDEIIKMESAVIDTPLKSNWHETAFRRIIKRAADEGYDTVTWTPGSVQTDRYPRGDPKIAEGMKAFYDGAIKNYAEKWGKKFGAKVNVTTINRGNTEVEVWQINITPEMKESVVTKGVPFYGIPAAIGAEKMLNQEEEITQNNTI